MYVVFKMNLIIKRGDDLLISIKRGLRMFDLPATQSLVNVTIYAKLKEMNITHKFIWPPFPVFIVVFIVLYKADFDRAELFWKVFFFRIISCLFLQI